MKAGQKYKASREKAGYPIGPNAKYPKEGPKVSRPNPHIFKEIKIKKTK